jgi:hypothetical protein
MKMDEKRPKRADFDWDSPQASCPIAIGLHFGIAPKRSKPACSSASLAGRNARNSQTCLLANSLANLYTQKRVALS